jgi:hypothetical protein
MVRHKHHVPQPDCICCKYANVLVSQNPLKAILNIPTDISWTVRVWRDQGRVCSLRENMERTIP